MSNIIETWMPFDQFSTQYPEYCPNFLLKINDYIVFYEIVSKEAEEVEPSVLYFSLEDAFAVLNQNES